jgi:hypothetical protein
VSARKHRFAENAMRVQEAQQRRPSCFEGLCIKAAFGAPDPLIAYFEEGPRLLSKQDCTALAWYFKRTLKRWFQPQRGDRGKGKHNRAGSETAYEVARQVVEQQKLWRQQHPTRTGAPRQNVPLAVTKQMIVRLPGGAAVLKHVLVLLQNKARL